MTTGATRKPIPLYYWPLWMGTLGLALIVFYVLLTPVWMGIRLVAWLSDRRLFRGS
jgi:hypothetical protein